MRFLVLAAGIATVAACGQEAVRSHGQLSQAPQEQKSLNPSISSVSNRAFKWQENSTVFSNNGIYYSRAPSDSVNQISATIFVIEDLSQYQGELRCNGNCIIVSRTDPALLKCKLVGAFRYEHIVEAADVPASIHETILDMLRLSEELEDEACGNEAHAEDQKFLKREFDRTFNRIKNQFQRAENKTKFQVGDWTYEGETVEIFDRNKANGIGRVSHPLGTWIITTFHLGDNWIAAEGVFVDDKANLVCAGTIQDLKVVSPSVCLKDGAYERK